MKKRGKKLGELRHIEISDTKARVTNVNKVMVDNFVSLQRVLTNLAVKMDNLSTQLTKLLEIFETSAKALAEKNFETIAKVEDKEILEKIDTLLEQNRTIAKSLSMLGEERVFPSSRMETGEMREQMQNRRFRQWPQY